MPGFALKLLLGEKASLVLDGQRTIPQRLLDVGYEFKFETLEPALRDLLLHPHGDESTVLLNKTR